LILLNFNKRKSENSEAIHQSEKEENIHKALPAVNFPKDTSFEDKNHNYNGNNDENFHEFNWYLIYFYCHL